ncbi:hypothetical protein EDC04DRAFT_2609299 [Pisolithus marmoratus]|nr:hypothetical protein EDC04DRAFT_2609299 [Pisolithus marmoratus]
MTLGRTDRQNNTPNGRAVWQVQEPVWCTLCQGLKMIHYVGSESTVAWLAALASVLSAYDVGIDVCVRVFDSVFTPNTAEFFRTSTGIENEEALKTHILIVQEMAYKFRIGITKQHTHKDTPTMSRERGGSLCGLGESRLWRLSRRNIVSFGPKKGRHSFRKAQPSLLRTKDTWPTHFVPGDIPDLAMSAVVAPAREGKQGTQAVRSTLTSFPSMADFPFV